MTIAMYAMRRRAEHMPESVGLWLERKEDDERCVFFADGPIPAKEGDDAK